jgi:proline dehydrogenase
LNSFGVASILDYGAEAKETEEEFNKTMNENIRAIEFAAQNGNVPVISTKITGLARFGLLEKMQGDEDLSQKETEEYKNVLKRIDSICHIAQQKGVGVFIDAEESWIQDAIDHLVNLMMERYNRDKIVVYNTFQMYRKDRLDYLKHSFEEAKSKNYILGAKLVRGAYMEKERDRAEDLGYGSPIHDNKFNTDKSYDDGIRFCVDHYEQIASCNASHNAISANLQADMIIRKGIKKDHQHLNFCQLLGMSDHLTFNLAKEGFNVAKYVVYGSVREVVPYLVRRAQENTSVTGDMSRELELIMAEVKRRGL